MASNTEIELKLLVSKADLKKLLALECVAPHIRKGSRKKRRLVSSYYDTEDYAFKRNGIAYRVRDKGDGSYEATVKQAAKDSAGLSERMELNMALPLPDPVLDGFAELGLGFELSELAPAGVRKLFTVNVERTTYVLDLDGAVAELAVDNGKITAGKATDKIDEIEIELLEGEKGALLDFAAEISAQVPLFVEKRSKFMRGLALCGLSAVLPTGKARMNGGSVRNELAGVLLQHAGILLDLQNTLREGEIKNVCLKEARRQLQYLRSYARCAALLAQSECDVQELEKFLTAVVRLRSLRALQRLWAQLNQRGNDMLGRTALNKRLLLLISAAEAELQQLAQAGSFTALVYALCSRLYKINLADDIGADSAVRSCLKAWQEQLKENEQVQLADDYCALARSMQGKYFAKAAVNSKKQRRRLHRQALLALWQGQLQEVAATSTSKVVHRDIGVVLGYLLAQQA